MDPYDYEGLRSKHIVYDPELKTVTFSLKDLKRSFDTPDDVEEYVNTILETKGITHVCLSGNTFGVRAGRALARALKCHDDLRCVDLSDIFTRRKEDEIPLVVDAFAETLADKSHLDELNLSDNAFGPTGARPLTKLLSRNYNIKKLIMNNNGLGTEGVKYISRALEEAHRRALKTGEGPMLESLSLGRNRIGNEGVKHLSNAIKLYSNKLSTFCLPQNSISGVGVEELMESLSHCNTLKHLDLQDNTFSIKGSLAFAKAVPKWDSLSFMNVSDCLFTPEGGIEVIKALTNGNRFLKHIYIGYNDIDREGALLIPKMLENKLLLLNLDLNGNTFSASGPHIDNIRHILSQHDRADCLGNLDDMDDDENSAYDEEYSSDDSNSDVLRYEPEEDAIPTLKIDKAPLIDEIPLVYVNNSRPAENVQKNLRSDSYIPLATSAYSNTPQKFPERDFVVYTSVPDRSTGTFKFQNIQSPGKPEGLEGLGKPGSPGKPENLEKPSSPGKSGGREPREQSPASPLDFPHLRADKPRELHIDSPDTLKSNTSPSKDCIKDNHNPNPDVDTTISLNSTHPSNKMQQPPPLNKSSDPPDNRDDTQFIYKIEDLK